MIAVSNVNIAAILWGMVWQQQHRSALSFVTRPSLAVSRQRAWIGKEQQHHKLQRIHVTQLAASASETTYIKVPDDDDTPIPFVDHSTNTFIECYADSIVTLPDGITYTVGEPCDYAVALGYIDERQGGLVPLELDDPMMDDVFPVAELIIEEEFGEELALQRTPQTLTLVGELEEGDEEGEEDDFGYEFDDEEDANNLEEDEEEVEILLSFEHRGKEFHVVRLLDPVLLVGKKDPENDERRILLTPGQADAVMPILEDIFLKNQKEA